MHEKKKNREIIIDLYVIVKHEHEEGTFPQMHGVNIL